MDENSRPDPETLLEELNEQEFKKNHGRLKIFFGYSAGVGKTYAMLEEAHTLKKAGVDVIIGYVEPHQRPETLALFDGLPQIPPAMIKYKDIVIPEFDIDSAIKRKPKVILVDELAHTNASGCRHKKRYQDIEELLHMGIDVYTTINVQHIEGLNDTVESVTGVSVHERVPDHIFNNADRIELIDIAPEDLISRLNAGKIYKDVQARRALNNFFTKENLIALREIALRKTADQINIIVEKNKTRTSNSSYFTGEHIMMCLSSSPTNAKVIRTAAKMAEAFKCRLTALFVETISFTKLSDDDKNRLRENLRLAEQLGAKIVTVYGEDVAYQMAEYAKTSGVSKVVIGRPASKNFLGFAPQNYVDKFTTFAPDIEVYVIPNSIKGTFIKRGNKSDIKAGFSFTDTTKSLLCLLGATLIGFAFSALGFSEANIITVYILATLFTAVITEGKVYSLISSLLAVLMFNFFFTEPTLSFKAYNPDYPFTFLVMFLSAFITSTFTKRVRDQAKQSSLQAYRTEVLLDTSQKFQQAKDIDTIFAVSISQIEKLLDRKVFLYPISDGSLLEAVTINMFVDEKKKYLKKDECAVAEWVMVNNKHAGATTDTLSGVKCLYMAVRSGDKVFAVVGIAMDIKPKLDAFEKSLLIAILSECALTIEKENILKSTNELILKSNREQLRANLLRAISHDLRTPLTGIAGGSGFLLESFDTLDDDNIKSILTDISTDALWLSNLVENLLNMTRIEDGKLTLSKKTELVEEVISAAISKVAKRSAGRLIEIRKTDDMILAPMDAQLIMQVIINLLDNAFKHTVDSSKIDVSYYKNDRKLIITVSDNGGGIPENNLYKIFELFYTSSETATDKERGMGLGLSICKSIIEAHGGTISASNNNIGGATFTIVLPLEGI